MLLRIGLVCLAVCSIAFAQRGGGATPTPATPGAASGAAGSGEGGPAAAGPAGGAAAARDQGSDAVLKALEIQKWYLQLGDIAEVNEIRYTSAPPHRSPNPTAPGAKNPMIIHAMTFVPKNLDRSKKQPLIVFAHQGIHSDFGRDYEYGAVKELVQQGYSVIGPDYRGSTGWGTGFYNQIDYGGLEVEDVYLAREWMLDNYDFLDLMNILLHPGSYAVAYAGVPVTDLVLRLGYHDASYQAIFAAPSHVGKPVSGDIQEYLKRSPITYADKLDTPLLIHGNTNDEDVNVIEIERFVTALKAAGKKFEYKIYENAPGGHEFGRLDTKLAKESRHDVYKFLAQYLQPERPVK